MVETLVAIKSVGIRSVFMNFQWNAQHEYCLSEVTSHFESACVVHLDDVVDGQDISVS
jgi:hypothetical protein